MACLSSRFPYGTAVTSEGLRQVDRAEKFMKDLICEQLRVRHHDSVARIELPANELGTLIADADQRRLIVTELTGIGYRRVTLDILGFRSGSMNEVLGDAQDAQRPDADVVLTELGYEGTATLEEQILCLQLAQASVLRLAPVADRLHLASALRHRDTPYIALDLTSEGTTA